MKKTNTFHSNPPQFLSDIILFSRIKKQLLAINIVICLVSLVIPLKLAGLEIVTATDSLTKLSLNSNLEILEDPNGQLQIEDVTSPEFNHKFKKANKETLNFGYTDSFYWVRVKIKNLSLLNEDWLIEAKPSNIKTIEIYKPFGNSNEYTRLKTGLSEPASSRDLRHHHFVFNVNLPFFKDQVFYFRYQNQSSMVVNLTLWHKLTFLDESRSQFFLLGLFYGIMLIMLFYNLFLYFALKDISYFYFVAFFASFLSWNVLYEGVAQVYIFPDNWIIDQKVMLALVTFSGIFLLGFSKAFLKVVLLTPTLGKTINALQVIALFSLSLLLFFSYGFVAKLVIYVGLFSVVTTACCLVVVRKRALKPARFYFAASGFFIFAFTLFLLVRLGLLPATDFNEFTFRFGIIWLVTMLSLALADSINSLKEEAQLANKELKNSEELFKAVFNQTYQLIGLLSPEGRVLKINETALNFSNINSVNIEGKLFWEGPWWNDDELREKVKDAVDKASKGEFIRFETYHNDFKGNRHIIDFSLKPLRNDFGEITLLIPEGRDITERKLMEDVIRESEEKYRTLIELAQDGILVVQGGKVKFANPYLSEMSGYGSDELIGMDVSKFIPAEQIDDVRKHYLLQKEGKTSSKIHETLFIHKDGSEKYVEFNFSPFTFDGGFASLVFIRNIHDNKIAKIELKESQANLETSEQRYQQLYHRSVVGMFTSRSTDGQVLSMNKEAARIFGLETPFEDSTLFYTKDLYVNMDDRAALLERLFEKGILYNQQVKLKKPNGQEFWAEFSIRHFPDQEIIEGSIKDITQNKEAEEVLNRSREELNQLVNERTKQLETSQKELILKSDQLELSNQKLQEAEFQTRSILENSPDYIFNVDTSNIIQYSNRSVNNLGKEELIGRNIIDFIATEHLDLIKKSVAKIVDNKTADAVEAKMKITNDEYRWFELRFANLRHDDKITQIMIIATDIHKRMLAENELVEAQKMAIDKAHKAGMADIASAILHNVGNLLNSVNTSVFLLMKTVQGSIYSNFQQANSILRENIDSLEDFILNNPKGKLLLKYYLKVEDRLNDEKEQIIQNISRVKQKLDLISAVITAQQGFTDADALTEKHSLNDIIDDTLTIHSGIFERSAINISKDYSFLPDVPVQKAKLVHILISILDNAAEAMMYIDKEQRQIRISTYLTKEGVYLRIEDSGVGIAKENLKKIFMHDYKNELGRQCFSLHCSAIYMSEMNGTIWAESAGKDQGATFILRFPPV